MATTYSEIYEEFLDRITDPDLLLLSELSQEETKRVYLEFAVQKIQDYVTTADLTKRTTVEIENEFGDLEEVDAFEDDLDNNVRVMLADYMTLAWLRPYMNNADLLRLHMNTKDFNTTSPANLLEKIGERFDEARRRARSLRNEYTYFTNDVSVLSTSKSKP